MKKGSMKMGLKIDKDFYTVPQLVKQPWFPIKSVITLRKMIDQHDFPAMDVSTNPKLKRYHIHKEVIMDFLVKRIKSNLKPKGKLKLNS